MLPTLIVGGLVLLSAVVAGDGDALLLAGSGLVLLPAVVGSGDVQLPAVAGGGDVQLPAEKDS